MTYPLLLATVLTSDLRRNAELPKFLVSKRKTTSDLVTDVSLVVSNLSYFEPSLKCRLLKIVKECQRLPNLEQFKRICTENRVICFLLLSHCHCFSSWWKKSWCWKSKEYSFNRCPCWSPTLWRLMFSGGGTRLAAMAALTTSCLYFHPRTNRDQGLKGKLPVIKSK